jgi:hypothetical protein
VVLVLFKTISKFIWSLLLSLIKKWGRKVLEIGGMLLVSILINWLLLLAFCQPIVHQPARFADECRNQLPQRL